MNDPFDNLTGRIGQSLETLRNRLEFLESKKKEFEQLKAVASRTPEQLVNSSGNVLIYLGDNYFVEQKPSQVVEFAERRILGLQNTGKVLTDNVKSAEKALADLTKLGLFGFDDNSTVIPVAASKTSVDSIPDAGSIEDAIFDIREELDDDGNIISSSLEPRTGNALDGIDSGAMKGLLDAMKSKSTDSKLDNHVLDHLINPRDEVQLKQEHLKPDLEENDETRQFNKDEQIVTLTEQSLPDLDGNNSKSPKSILKSPRGSISGFESSGDEGGRRKSVSFAEELDIVEAENAKEESSIDPPTPLGNISPEELITFEMMAQQLEDEEDFDGGGEYEFDNEQDGYYAEDEDDYQDEDEDDYDDDDNDNHGSTGGFPGVSESMMNAIKEERRKALEASINGISEIVPQSQPAEESQADSKPKVSRFKATRIKNTQRAETASASKSRDTIGAVGDITERVSNLNISSVPVSDTKESLVSTIKDSPVQEIQQTQPLSNPKPSARKSVAFSVGKSNSVSREEIEIIKDKNLKNMDGMYPDGFDKEIFDKAMEYFLEGGMTEEDFIEAHDNDEDEEDQGFPIPQSEPAVKTPINKDVIERDIDHEVEDEDLDDENAVNMGEVAEDYQRLRQKLINRTGGFKKTDKEMETEPIEEETKKVSRFKATRLTNRMGGN